MKRTISLASALALIVLFRTIGAYASAKDGQAAVTLVNADAALSQTGNTSWALTKTGTVDTNASTVTWTITATVGATTSGRLVVDGVMTVYNSGTKGATIGNIVVNLQVKSGSSWKTESSDIADATHGDAATHAYIDPHASSEDLSQFTTDSASGTVEFMDATSNTVFSLNPQKTIAPGTSVTLRFEATFDNNTLKLADGTSVRAETIVSFGNSTSTPPSADNVDINGNGAIDADEVWVRSIPARITMTIPSQTGANGSPTLADTTSNIATTGTVTYSNPQFNLGTTSGTVEVTYSGGTQGGKITNCAHLTSADSTITVGGYTFTNVAGMNLQACDTETIAANGITAGWQNGDFTTYGQGEWPSGTAESLLTSDYDTVYSSTGGAFVIGDASGFTATFDSATALEAYLPQSGAAGVLTGNLFDPTTSSAGAFGGDIAALKLNVDFSDAGDLTGTANLKFGDLTLCNISSPAGLNGTTVRKFLATASSVLGAASTSFTAGDLDPVAVQVAGAFDSGSPSTWAQQHLLNGACPVWNNGDLVTYSQAEWANVRAENLLLNDYGTVYASNSDVFVIGYTSGFTATFDAATALQAFLPQSGAVGILTGNLFDPPTSSAGTFGGDVASLKLNIDFSDAGDLQGNLSLKFGDLTLCNISSPTGLNGTTVRSFLATANTELGGGSTSFTATDLDSIAIQVSGSFDSGSPSTWAQQHLRNGACQ